MGWKPSVVVSLRNGYRTGAGDGHVRPGRGADMPKKANESRRIESLCILLRHMDQTGSERQRPVWREGVVICLV